MRTLLTSLFYAIFFCASLFAHAQNAVPFVNQPLVPASVAPGGAGFTLTVNGTGFVSGSTVNWNGSPRATMFVSGSQLTAAILSSDIANATTASITVSSPGVTTSNIVFLSVREPSTFVSLNATGFGTPLVPQGVIAADFNKDGKVDLAMGFASDIADKLSILIGNGDGTFTQGFTYPADVIEPIAADINGDGNLDLIFTSVNTQEFQSLGVMLGNGDGTFQPPTLYKASVCCQLVLGDFNHDGELDVATPYSTMYCIFLGNGNGTFASPSCSGLPQPAAAVAVGDFNSDGKLDLIFPGIANGTSTVMVYLGNGDGTFTPGQSIDVSGSVSFVATGDLSGDGILDLAVSDTSGNDVLVFLGNGDGTFRSPSSFATAISPRDIAISDMNGDGIPDLIVTAGMFNASAVSVLLGNGDGTFQTHTDYGALTSEFLALADFNDDGKMDLAATPDAATGKFSVLLQDNGSVVNLSPNKLTFPTQLVGAVSPAKVIVITNDGTSLVNVSNVAIDANFSQLNNCKNIQPGGSCKIGVYFTPTIQGNLIGYLAITDNGGGSPQTVALNGVATIVSTRPTSLNFGNEPVGHISKSQNVVVTNEGNSQMAITEIGIDGADPKDFSQVNACPQKLAAGASCEITVIFHPIKQGARDAILGIMDNGGGSPQQVPLSGNGT
jgi:hypothetical protein